MTPPKKREEEKQSEYNPVLCDSCPFHGTQDYRLGELERENHEKDECLKSIKDDVKNLVTGLAVMQQKFDNLRIPIWIIFGALLLQVAKWVGTFNPVAASVVEKVM